MLKATGHGGRLVCARSTDCETCAGQSTTGKEAGSHIRLHRLALYTVPHKTPSHLKLHVEPSLTEDPGQPADLAGWPALSDAFAQATGWQLSHQPGPAAAGKTGGTGTATAIAIPTSSGEAPGRLVLTRRPADEAALDFDPPQRIPRQRALSLAESLAGLLGELYRTRDALWRREAELAAGVPVVQRSEEEQHLAARLQAVLEGAAERLDCQAAAAYLLDENTSQLKLRTSWGLPTTRMLESPRPLSSALADLEALTGHAVVIENTRLLPHWNAPENFAAAACVPVSTPTVLLGTLWFFAESPRDFSSQDTNLMEIIAGRLAAELEREMLLAAQVVQHAQQPELAETDMIETVRPVPPMLDGWDFSGWSADGRSGFYQWLMHEDSSLALTVGRCGGGCHPTAITPAPVQSAVRTQLPHDDSPGGVLSAVGEWLCAASAGDGQCELFHAHLDPVRGRLEFAAAGAMWGAILRPHGGDLLPLESRPLGPEPEIAAETQHQIMASGDVLVVASAGLPTAGRSGGRKPLEESLSDALRRRGQASADELAIVLREVLATRWGLPASTLTLLVVRRR